jgi:hypothetical protein
VKTPAGVRARRVEVDKEIDDVPAPGYASAFEVDFPPTDLRSPEQWARDTFEGAPRVMRWFVLMGWRYVMWFRLGPRQCPDHVLGWSIAASAADAMTLEVRSGLATAHKVVRVEVDRVVMTTFVVFERRLGRAVWSAITPIHHRTEPYLLRRAASHPRRLTDSR